MCLDRLWGGHVIIVGSCVFGDPCVKCHKQEIILHLVPILPLWRVAIIRLQPVFSMSARCTNSKSNSDSRRGHQASRPAETAKLRIRFSASWSLRMMRRSPSMYDEKTKTVLKIAGIHVEWWYHTAFQRQRKRRCKNQNGFVVLSSCVFYMTHIVWTLHASEPCVMCPPE